MNEVRMKNKLAAISSGREYKSYEISPEITGSPMPSKGTNMTFRSASLIIAAAVRVYKAGFSPEISHVYRL
jgi:hypothetical protein